VAQAAPDELEAVRDLLARANEPFRAIVPAEAFEPYLAVVQDLESRAEAASLLVVRAGGRPGGTVTFFPDATAEGWGGPSGVSSLRSMAVDPGRRHAGIGSALVAECRRRAEGTGARALTLRTADWLPEAIRLYERCGFVREPEQDRPASQLLGVPEHVDFVALAYRLELGRPAR
jgi:GNAT superfamily N-acetyltransferase